MAKKPAVSIDSDFDEGYEFAGVVTGMTSTIKTNRFTSSVLEMAHAMLAEDFDQHIDAIAKTNPSALHHVYEWRMIGLAKGRLWSHTLVGRGKTREASWEWLPSEAPILTPAERMKDPLRTNDPMQAVNPDDLDKLSDQSYYFHWKAPMMEFGLPARVRPKQAKRLFVPTWHSPKGYHFSMETLQDFSAGNPQDGSGGRGTMGNFTAIWQAWWNNAAPKSFDDHVNKVVEKDIGVGAKELLRSKRKRYKTVTLKTMGDKSAAFESGRNRAEAYFLGRAKNYTQASRYIGKHGKFGMDVDYG